MPSISKRAIAKQKYIYAVPTSTVNGNVLLPNAIQTLWKTNVFFCLKVFFISVCRPQAQVDKPVLVLGDWEDEKEKTEGRDLSFESMAVLRPELLTMFTRHKVWRHFKWFGRDVVWRGVLCYDQRHVVWCIYMRCTAVRVVVYLWYRYALVRDADVIWHDVIWRDWRDVFPRHCSFWPEANVVISCIMCVLWCVIWWLLCAARHLMWFDLISFVEVSFIIVTRGTWCDIMCVHVYYDVCCHDLMTVLRWPDARRGVCGKDGWINLNSS